MKTCIIFFCLLLTLDSFSQIQKNRNEIQISYGPLARELVVLDAFDNFGRSLIREPIKRITFSRTYAVTYRYQTKRRLAVGLSTGFSSGTSFKNYLFEPSSNYAHTGFILTFEAKFNYLVKPNLILYCFGGGGGFLMREKNLDEPYKQPKTFANPTLQFTPFGIRLGKQLGAFAEIGYGYKGIVNAGLSARF